MTSAQARMEAQQRLSERRVLLDKINRIPVPRLLAYAANESLPPNPGRWSSEQLAAALPALEAGATSLTPSTPMSPKTKATASAVDNTGKSFHISYPVGKPAKATGVVLKGEAPETDDTTVHFTVASAADLKDVPMPALLALVNATRTTPIKKFVNQEAAEQAAFQALLTRAQPPEEEQGDADEAAPTKKSAKKAAAPAEPKGPRFKDREPKAKDQIRAVKAGTKVATAIDLLAQEGGVLLSELEAELSKTGKPVSARAWLGYDVGSVVGYGYRHEVDGDDIRVYLVLPKGMKQPLAHKEAAPAKPEPETPVQKAAKKTAAKKAAEPEQEAEVEVAEEPEVKAPKKAATKAASAPKPGREGKQKARR